MKPTPSAVIIRTQKWISFIPISCASGRKESGARMTMLGPSSPLIRPARIRIRDQGGPPNFFKKFSIRMITIGSGLTEVIASTKAWGTCSAASACGEAAKRSR